MCKALSLYQWKWGGKKNSPFSGNSQGKGSCYVDTDRRRMRRQWLSTDALAKVKNRTSLLEILKRLKVLCILRVQLLWYCVIANVYANIMRTKSTNSMFTNNWKVTRNKFRSCAWAVWGSHIWKRDMVAVSSLIWPLSDNVSELKTIFSLTFFFVVGLTYP